MEVVYARADGEVVLGFNSPYTLFCPVPGAASNETLKRTWAEVSKSLTGSEHSDDWEADAMERWDFATLAICQIRTWIAAEKRIHGGTSPPWTHIFDSEATLQSAPYGRGRKLSVYWETAADESCIEVALPTARTGNYWPDDDTLPITESELLDCAPEIRELQTEQITFEMATFKLPNRATPIRAFWREHLEQLQQRGSIAAFGDRPDESRLAILTADLRNAAILKNVIVLDRDLIMIRACSPMQQDPVTGSATMLGHTLYPDYPLRSDYLDLAKTNDNRNVLDLLKRCKSFDVSPPAIDEGPRGRSATWNLRLRGRSDPLPITLPVPADNALHKAHWMVWPRFRSSMQPEWRAYYIYEHCTDARVHVGTLWLDSDTNHLHRSDALDQGGTRPIQFAAGDRREHTGGPPIALTAKNVETDQELGLYAIRLHPLSRRDVEVKVGIDFGTSHTVASVETDGEKALVQLAAELDSAVDTLTLHLSENWSHVTDKQEGLQKLSLWLPTYVRTTLQDAAGLLPSELLTIQPLNKLTATDVARWQPGLDCVIPVMDMQRPDLADHLLADFKWDVSFPAFRGRESNLREIYLGMVTELVMADVAWRRLQALPGGPVRFTFTYPLRTSPSEVESYEQNLRRVMDSGTRSLGLKLGLTRDIGIYNESRAAKGGTRQFGEVCLVGDLGGGTLDLFISANAGPDIEFKEVADSAQLGGNQLLRIIAQQSDRLLPNSAGWAAKPVEIETQLRAWMRSLGSARLFGMQADGAERHAGLNVSGFDKRADANEVRTLINRYFRLIEEYMSRSLVAFLAGHWYEEVLRVGQDPSALRILVQIRGNGWRLWHETADYRQIERQIAEYIDRRVKTLWEVDGLWRDTRTSASRAPNCIPGGSSTADSKEAPILEAVGKALAHADIDTYSHALVELHLLRARGSAADQPTKIRWFDPLPFRTGGGKELRIEFRAVEPPFPLSHPDQAPPSYLADLEASLKKNLNAKLQEYGATNDLDFWAPIAALVWEAAFKSQRFLSDL